MCIEALKSNDSDLAFANQILSILNSILHITESMISQEELPDFYEEQLPTISA